METVQKVSGPLQLLSSAERKKISSVLRTNEMLRSRYSKIIESKQQTSQNQLRELNLGPLKSQISKRYVKKRFDEWNTFLKQWSNATKRKILSKDFRDHLHQKSLWNFIESPVEDWQSWLALANSKLDKLKTQYQIKQLALRIQRIEQIKNAGYVIFFTATISFAATVGIGAVTVAAFSFLQIYQNTSPALTAVENYLKGTATGIGVMQELFKAGLKLGLLFGIGPGSVLYNFANLSPWLVSIGLHNYGIQDPFVQIPVMFAFDKLVEKAFTFKGDTAYITAFDRVFTSVEDFDKIVQTASLEKHVEAYYTKSRFFETFSTKVNLLRDEMSRMESQKGRSLIFENSGIRQITKSLFSLDAVQVLADTFITLSKSAFTMVLNFATSSLLRYFDPLNPLDFQKILILLFPDLSQIIFNIIVKKYIVSTFVVGRLVDRFIKGYLPSWISGKQILPEQLREILKRKITSNINWDITFSEISAYFVQSGVELGFQSQYYSRISQQSEKDRQEWGQGLWDRFSVECETVLDFAKTKGVTLTQYLDSIFDFRNTDSKTDIEDAQEHITSSEFGTNQYVLHELLSKTSVNVYSTASQVELFRTTLQEQKTKAVESLKTQQEIAISKVREFETNLSQLTSGIENPVYLETQLLKDFNPEFDIRKNDDPNFKTNLDQFVKTLDEFPSLFGDARDDTSSKFYRIGSNNINRLISGTDVRDINLQLNRSAQETISWNDFRKYIGSDDLIRAIFSRNLGSANDVSFAIDRTIHFKRMNVQKIQEQVLSMQAIEQSLSVLRMKEIQINNDYDSAISKAAALLEKFEEINERELDLDMVEKNKLYASQKLTELGRDPSDLREIIRDLTNEISLDIDSLNQTYYRLVYPFENDVIASDSQHHMDIFLSTLPTKPTETPLKNFDLWFQRNQKNKLNNMDAGTNLLNKLMRSYVSDLKSKSNFVRRSRYYPPENIKNPNSQILNHYFDSIAIEAGKWNTEFDAFGIASRTIENVAYDSSIFNRTTKQIDISSFKFSTLQEFSSRYRFVKSRNTYLDSSTNAYLSEQQKQTLESNLTIELKQYEFVRTLVQNYLDCTESLGLNSAISATDINLQHAFLQNPIVALELFNDIPFDFSTREKFVSDFTKRTEKLTTLISQVQYAKLSPEEFVTSNKGSLQEWTFARRSYQNLLKFSSIAKTATIFKSIDGSVRAPYWIDNVSNSSLKALKYNLSTEEKYRQAVLFTDDTIITDHKTIGAHYGLKTFTFLEKMNTGAIKEAELFKYMPSMVLKSLNKETIRQLYDEQGKECKPEVEVFYSQLEKFQQRIDESDAKEFVARFVCMVNGCENPQVKIDEYLQNKYTDQEIDASKFGSRLSDLMKNPVLFEETWNQYFQGSLWDQFFRETWRLSTSDEKRIWSVYNRSLVNAIDQVKSQDYTSLEIFFDSQLDEVQKSALNLTAKSLSEVSKTIVPPSPVLAVTLSQFKSETVSEILSIENTFVRNEKLVQRMNNLKDQIIREKPFFTTWLQQRFGQLFTDQNVLKSKTETEEILKTVFGSKFDGEEVFDQFTLKKLGYEDLLTFETIARQFQSEWYPIKLAIIQHGGSKLLNDLLTTSVPISYTATSRLREASFGNAIFLVQTYFQQSPSAKVEELSKQVEKELGPDAKDNWQKENQHLVELVRKVDQEMKSVESLSFVSEMLTTGSHLLEGPNSWKRNQSNARSTLADKIRNGDLSNIDLMTAFLTQLRQQQEVPLISLVFEQGLYDPNHVGDNFSWAKNWNKNNTMVDSEVANLLPKIDIALASKGDANPISPVSVYRELVEIGKLSSRSDSDQRNRQLKMQEYLFSGDNLTRLSSEAKRSLLVGPAGSETRFLWDVLSWKVFAYSSQQLESDYKRWIVKAEQDAAATFPLSGKQEADILVQENRAAFVEKRETEYSGLKADIREDLIAKFIVENSDNVNVESPSHLKALYLNVFNSFFTEDLIDAMKTDAAKKNQPWRFGWSEREKKIVFEQNLETFASLNFQFQADNSAKEQISQFFRSIIKATTDMAEVYKYQLNILTYMMQLPNFDSRTPELDTILRNFSRTQTLTVDPIFPSLSQ